MSRFKPYSLTALRIWKICASLNGCYRSKPHLNLEFCSFIREFVKIMRFSIFVYFTQYGGCDFDVSWFKLIRIDSNDFFLFI